MNASHESDYSETLPGVWAHLATLAFSPQARAPHGVDQFLKRLEARRVPSASYPQSSDITFRRLPRGWRQPRRAFGKTPSSLSLSRNVVAWMIGLADPPKENTRQRLLFDGLETVCREPMATGSAKGWPDRKIMDYPFRERFRPTASEEFQSNEALRQAALRALANAYLEASQPGWDGPDSRLADAASHSHALRLAQMLPLGLDRFEAIVDPDGQMALEWYGGPDRLFSVSVGPDGRLYWAGRFGTRKIHGSAILEHSLPKEIVDYVRSVIENSD